MPATRSRTENWQRSLKQIAERGGSIEITLASRSNELRNAGAKPAAPDPEHKNLIWRVRLVEVSGSVIVVERPFALGQGVDLRDGSPLVGLYTVGQNRWMFRTRVTAHEDREGRSHDALVLQAPEGVERCQRRNFYRISTIGLQLPAVEAYPLLDPTSTAVAETACRQEIEQMIDRGIAGRITPEGEAESVAMPEVAPPVPARLVNLGGGGVGIVVEHEDKGAFENHRAFWLRIDLQPHIPAPIGVAARLRHTNLDSHKRLYAGMVFDFANGSRHQQFVVNQLCKYVADVQRDDNADTRTGS